ncbi:MAG TPA: LacI family transcriptional regulator [Caldithrix abyssi]|uniref:LacI family transcriptional regulator n=1 Tax=Caldithrix abyssi TaxID=187145 RepID=A0A7V4U3W8_CALAY|nr:LacI family transcriptional regulator [Caldithrix abyssi]
MQTNINEIARRCGVSIATVSRVFNNKGPIKESTRQKVLQVARELNYHPNYTARGLSRRKTDTIGVILPELNDEFFMNIIHGIDEVANRNKQYLLVSSSHSRRNDVETMLDFMGSGRVDGIILLAPGICESVIELKTKSRYPLVLLNCGKGIKDIVSFGVDNYRGAYLMTEHLIGHGYRKIAIVKGPEQNTEAIDRFQGFSDAMRDNRLGLKDALVVSGDFSFKSGYYGFLRLMGNKEQPEAIFFSNDMMALGAYDAARSSGINIPGDVAITGFDDIFSGRIIDPRLTTVNIPIMELGSKAAEYLLKMIKGEVDPRQPYKEVLSTALIIGGSCGCSNGTTSKIIA